MMCNVASTDSEESLRSKRLTAVPERLKSLTALTSLDLSDNPLTELPDWLGNLTALTSLDISSNELTELPADAAK